MKTTNIATLNIMFAFLAMFAMASCTSTDILEPSDNSGKGTTITLNVASPDAYVFSPTRADGTDPHEGHQLRYVAKLFNVNAPASREFVAKKEILAKDGNTVVFNAPEGEYTVAVFADYIDENATVTEGHYPDKYYDTASKDDFIEAFKTPKASGDATPARMNINNDNYDCFATISTFNKGAKPYEENLTLTRAVCKINIVNNGGNVNGVNNIKITDFSFISQYSFEKGASVKRIEYTGTELGENASTEISGNILFYFYSFANYNPGGGLKPISFDVNAKENYEYPSRTLPVNDLDFKKNIIYNIQGNYLSPDAYPSDEITLHVSTDDNWESTKDVSLN